MGETNLKKESQITEKHTMAKMLLVHKVAIEINKYGITFYPSAG